MQLPFPQFLPKSDWKPIALSDLPDLSQAKEIAFDCETYDPELTERGCGGVRGKGFVTGYSVGVDGWSKYLPLRHSGGNLPIEPVQRWVSDQLSRSDQPKVTANGGYDREWAFWSGLTIYGNVYDIQIAECLLNEERDSYSLDTLAKEYTGQGKDESLMDEAAWYYGDEAKKIMHLLHSSHVGLYGERDALATLAVWHKQKVKLLDNNLWSIFQMETELSELVFKMRQKGVRLDIDGCEKLAKQYKQDEIKLYRQLQTDYFSGRNIDFNSSKDLEKVCQAHNFTDYPRTKKGNPSFVGDWMDLQEWGFFKGVSEFRTIEKIRRDFLEGAFLGSVHNGRIHAQFNQLRGEDGGTRSGRFSCCNPNLQQVPKRSKYAKDVRALFLPEDGSEWIAGDYSQQEYRIFVHYAMLMNMEGAKEAGDVYIKNPEADFHQGIADMTGLSRQDAKNWNFAAIYGAGLAKTAKMTKKTMDDAKKVNDQYHAKVPYAKALSKDVSNRASSRGWIKTLGNRLLHFETYEPAWSGEEDSNGVRHKATPLLLEMALKKWPGQRLKRGQTHKALNRLVQGSAADMMKIAMLNLYKKHGIIPHLQVHDELDASGDAKVALQMKEEMVNAIKLLVPIQVDFSMGKSWGKAEKVKL